jgi:hypothetical protein
MVKRKDGSQIGSLIPDDKKSKIDQMSLRAGGTRHVVGKLLTKATTSLHTHSDRWSTQEIIVPQSCASSNLEDFEIPIWESQEKKPFG